MTVGAGRRLDWRRIEVVDPDVATALRAKSGVERLRLAHEAWEFARHRLAVFVAWRHPEWTTEQVAREVAKRLANDGS
jgi:hypothetical protein